MANPPPVEIQFTTKGLDEVQRALRNIADIVARVEKVSKAKAVVSAMREEIKARNDVTSSIKKAVAAEVAATAARRAGLQQLVKGFKEVAAESSKEVQKRAKDLKWLESFEKGHANRVLRAHERAADARAKADDRASKAAEKAAQKEVAKKGQILFGNPTFTREGAIGRGFSAGGKLVGGIARGAVDAMGGFSVTDAIQSEVALRGRAASIAASSPGDFNAGEIRSRAQEVATAQGVDPSQVLDLYDSIKKMTGRLDFAMNAAPDIAKIATATGADLGDVGGLAGNILAANPKISKEDLSAQIRLFAQQGMVGGVELGDFAKYGGRITAGASLFGGDSSKNQATLGGFAQIARQYGGAASAAEATLASQRFATDVAKKSDHLKGMGINVSDGNGKLRSAEDIALDMLDKTGGDVTKLNDLKLGERGNRVMTGLSEIYRSAGGGEAGKNAVKAEVSKYSNASMSADEVELRNKKRLAATDIQLNKALIKLKAEAGDKLVPVLARFIDEILVPGMPKIEALFETFAKFTNFLINNPWTGLATVVGAAIAKEVVTAFAMSAFQKRLADAGSSAGKLAGAMGIAAAATLAYAVGKEAIDQDVKDANSKDDKRRALINEVTNLTKGGTAAGTGATVEERERAAALAEQVKKAQADLQNDANNPSMLKKGFTKLIGAVDPGAAAEMAASDKANVDAQNKALADALKELTRVMKENGPPAPPGPANPGNGSRGNGGPVGSKVRSRPE